MSLHLDLNGDIPIETADLYRYQKYLPILLLIHVKGFVQLLVGKVLKKWNKKPESMMMLGKVWPDIKPELLMHVYIHLPTAV